MTPPDDLLVTGAGQEGRSVSRIRQPDRTTVIAKVYPDQAGAHAASVQSAIHHLIRGRAGGPLRVPAVVEYRASEQLLLQELAPGRGLREAIFDGDVTDVSSFGHAVAQLHRLPIDIGTAASFDDYVTTVMRPAPSELARARPDLAGAITDALDTLRAWYAGSTTVTWIHRDLHPAQALVADGQVWLVDWDLAGFGDPALDVGNLLVWFETHLSPRLAARSRDAFMTGYVIGGGDVTGQDLAHGRACSYLRLACKRHRTGHADGPDPMLAAAQKALR